MAWEQGGNGEVFIQLNQTTSHPSVDFFEMPVPILLKGNGQEKLVRLENTVNGELFAVEDVPFNVTSVEFDPDLWLISANNTVEQKELVATETSFADEKLQLYPNPAGSFLQVFYEGKNAASNTNWLIVNQLGQSVKSGEINPRNITIDISGMTVGLYSFVLRSPSGNGVVRHFIKD